MRSKKETKKLADAIELKKLIDIAKKANDGPIFTVPEFLKPDMINHPPHYKRDGIEVIDVIEAFDLNYRLGNVVKYVLRHDNKGGIEDLKKARWYLDREINKQSTGDK